MKYETKTNQRGTMVFCPDGETKWFPTEREADEWIEEQEEPVQEFGQGDIAELDGVKVKITSVIQEEDGSWWYEVVPVEFEAFAREVAQSRLHRI